MSEKKGMRLYPGTGAARSGYQPTPQPIGPAEVQRPEGSAIVPPSGRGGSRPGAGRPGWDTPAGKVSLPPDVAQQLLTLTQARRAETGDRKLSQTAVVCELIAAAHEALSS